MKENHHGTYEVVSERAFLEASTKSKYCVAHFFHNDFRRCQIMDKHLTTLAKKHFRTRFVKVDVEQAHFLVEKLKVQTLPCLIMFEDGISVDRIVGFDELGGTDTFTTSSLEQRLAKSVVLKLTMPSTQKKKSMLGFAGDDEQ